MRRRGYALSELLVAVAIAGLIIGTLTFLNVDYISLGRRVADIQAPYALGTRAQRFDPCAAPGGVLAAGEDKVVAEGPQDTTTVLTLVPQYTDIPRRAATQLITPTGVAGTSRRPVRVVVEAAQTHSAAQGATPGAAQGATGGASMAAIEVGGATVGVVSPRCELRQVCDYDATNAMCKQDEAQAVAEPS